ncbi:hypothetical protein BKA64DRAFT_660936 [Cadophora sp. MPI-SDFR-AT-0126]|nr:hypothetical protein BKA64DRAFT_660936 [Leotiomycetes sp. MPI-SDFR-AT-0126]
MLWTGCSLEMFASINSITEMRLRLSFSCLFLLCMLSPYVSRCRSLPKSSRTRSRLVFLDITAYPLLDRSIKCSVLEKMIRL